MSSATSGQTSQPKVISHILRDDGTFPNNERLPLVVYQGRLSPGIDLAARFEALFSANGWPSAWRSSVFAYHHYHSTTHEVLGIFSGSGRVQFGGDDGVILEVQPGDVVIIPAGVAHKNMGEFGGFRCVGAYPQGQPRDIHYGQPGERPGTDGNIAQTPLPKADPAYGRTGPLSKLWSEGSLAP
jgi:uncharacterized protein YjlB